MTEVILNTDIRSIDRGGQLIARAGTVVDFISNEGDYIIAQLKDGTISFPLDGDEYSPMSDGIPFQEVEVSEDVLPSNRNKAKFGSDKQ